jgi:hypothetical protein
MIGGLSYPAVTRRTRACPAIVNPGTPMGPDRRAAARPPGPPSAGLPPAPASPTISSSTSSSRSWCSAAATAASPIPAARRPPCAAAAMSGSAPGWPSSCAVRCWPLTTGCSGWELEQLVVDGCITKAPCGGQVAGPSPVDRRKQGLKRSILTDADGIPWGQCPLRPTTATTGCWQRPWTPQPLSARCRSGRWCTWTPATTTRPAGRCWLALTWCRAVVKDWGHRW